MITVDQFHEKYGVLPSVFDPRWRRELERSKVLSKMQVVEYPILNPGKCVECGASTNDRKYVDLGVDLDPSDDPKFAYAVYICMICIRELMMVAYQHGLDPQMHIADLNKIEPVAKRVDAVAEMAVPLELSRLEEKIDDLHNTIKYYFPANTPERISSVPEPETKQNSRAATGAEPGSPKSNPGRRPKGIPSLEQLLKDTGKRP